MTYPKETYTSILERARASVSGDISTQEGSLVYNALSALALEAERLYTEMAYIKEQSHADTADMEHLKLITADRGITAREATPCEVSAVSNVPLPIGSRFNLKGYNYRVAAALPGALTYRLVCEEAGAVPNSISGQASPIDYIEGLTSCRITETLVPGREAETREELFERYLKSFSEDAFGGNAAQYKQELKKVTGVGGVKIYPAYAGGGTVKAVIQAADYGAPSDYLVKQVQELFCPVPRMGYGIAPIGHDFTAEAARTVPVDVVTHITVKAGLSVRDFQASVQAAAEQYLLELRKAWEAQDGERTHGGLTVYISKLEAVILDAPGVLDASGTTLNGSPRNLELADTELPVVKGVSIL